MKKFRNTVLKYIRILFIRDNNPQSILPMKGKRYTHAELENFAKKLETPVQRYTKSELALLYNRSVATLMSWINQHEILLDELRNRGYKKTLKEFRKEHVLLIFAYLGEP
ncbi:MAG: DUF4248 domain-containing protein, partial [Bacteroidales bacterium]|nr:DUF4248 domain-containing protein [Bacteroidales bacterium]